MPNSFIKSPSVVCSMVSKIGLRLTLASVIFMGLVQTASVSLVAAAGNDRFIPDRGEPSSKPPHGFRVAGPPMLNKPIEARHAPLDPRAMHRAGAQAVGVSPNIAVSGSRPGVIALVPKNAVASAVNVSSPNVTGINHWWTYEEDAIPGGGRYMVNVGTGNLLVQYDDMDVPNKGIDLAFRRTYNSASTHDYANTDGSTPSNYGDGWTNTFDAHLATNNAGGLSIYDIDGARYDYVSNGTGGWTPPPGQYATLTWDGGNGYFWTKKSGTVYYFYAPNQPPLYAGFSGRLTEIFGRNHNNVIQFSYAFDNPSLPTAANLNTITATTEAGQAATLHFVDWIYGTAKFRLLGTLTWPDGTAVAYHYRAGTELAAVDQPSNNSAGTLRSQSFGWSANHIIYNASSPIYTASSGANGGYIGFALSSGRVTQVSYHAVVNPAIPDGTNSGVLQAGAATGMQQYKTVTYTTNLNSAETSVGDSDGHKIDYFWDPQARVKYIHAWSSSTAFLTSYNVWDSQNNLTATLDPRSSSVTDTTYRTDYAYDGNGNTVAVAHPPASSGAYRPTALYSYDSFNNVTAYCDPMWSHANGHDWTSPPAVSDSLCPNQTGTTRYTWQALSTLGESISPEPYGELVSSQSPMGYQSTFAYVSSAQGGDFGLPTSVTGTAFTQIDGSSIAPTQSFTYNSHGNLSTYNKGNGATSIAYDAIDRPTQVVDADGVASYRSYYPDGLLRLKESAYQHGTGTGVSYTYDADRSELTEVHHHANTAATTHKWYDGMDRLVEVALPHDAADFYPTDWMTRYIYDLSQNNTVTMGGDSYGTASMQAHGNLYKTQKYIADTIQSDTAVGTQSWKDAVGTSFDALDRPITKFYYQPGDILRSSTNAYDAGSSSLGLLSSVTHAAGDTTSLTYDAIGRQRTVQFAADGLNVRQTADRTYAYDPDGRVASISTSAYGTLTYSFDAGGNVSTVTEPQGGTGISSFSGSGNVSSPAVISYSYYPNGMKAGVSVSASAITQTNLKQYSYRPDGLIRQRRLTYNGNTYNFGATYTAAGRAQFKDDPYRTHATAVAYDQNGRITSYAIPAGSYSGFNYDAEDNLQSFTPSTTGKAETMTYNARGEMLTQSYSSLRIVSAYGTAYQPNTDDCFLYGMNDKYEECGYWYDKFDARVGARLGRYWKKTSDTGPGKSVAPSPIGYEVNGTTGGTHDAENRLATIWKSGSINSQYAWGPNGHPLQNFMIDSTHTQHWDGDSILFSSQVSSGRLDDLKLDELADIVPSDPTYTALTVWDRDFSGTVVSGHNATGVGWWGASSQSLANNSSIYAGYQYALPQPGAVKSTYLGWTGNTGGAPMGTASDLGFLFQVRPDGYADGNTVIQGVRAYDPHVGAWTSPDAYAGDVHDPMSQQAYMWNRNNPVMYQDPSGYDTITMIARDAADSLLFEHVYIQVKKDNGKIVRFSFGPLKSGNQATKSPLVRKNDRMDAPFDNNNYGSKELAKCIGTCTTQNGGFDESSLTRTAVQIQALHLTYGFPQPNSNSAAYTLCADGGGGAQCNNPPGWAIAPGWGRSLVGH